MRHLDPPARPTRAQRRVDIGSRLLDGLEAIVRRHSVLDVSGGLGNLHAELIAAEVAHELSLARSALRLAPPIPPGDAVA